MAKTNKPDSCPKCGSIHLEEVRANDYLCMSCNTNFSGDTNETAKDSTIKAGKRTFDLSIETAKKIGKLFTVLAFLFFVYRIVLVLFFSSNSVLDNLQNQESAQVETPLISNVEVLLPLKSKGILVADTANISLEIVVALYKNASVFENEYAMYAYYIDPTTGEELNRQGIKADFLMKGAGAGAEVEYTLTTDAGNETYLVINNYFLYKLNKQSKRFDVVGHHFFDPYTEFASGVSAVAFDDRYDGLRVNTHTGKNYLFWPTLKEVRTVDLAEEVFELLLTEPTTKMGYVFTKASTEFPNTAKQLIAYTQEVQNGYPVAPFEFGWTKEYSEVSTNGYKKVLLPATIQEKARISTYKDITPKHVYSDDSTVLGDDEEGVLIATRLPNNESTTFTLQKIAKSSGKVLWTKETEWEKFVNHYQVGNQIFLTIEHTFYVLDMTGEVLSKVEDMIELKVDK